jgi:hypothetical protein
MKRRLNFFSVEEVTRVIIIYFHAIELRNACLYYGGFAEIMVSHVILVNSRRYQNTRLENQFIWKIEL